MELPMWLLSSAQCMDGIHASLTKYQACGRYQDFGTQQIMWDLPHGGYIELLVHTNYFRE